MNKKLLYLILALFVMAAAIFLLTQNRASTLNQDLYDFAVEDTAAVSKIFIADSYGKSIYLEEENGTWYIGKDLNTRADQFHINLMLKTLHQLGLKSPVSRKNVNTYLELIAENHKKVEIYTDDKKTPSKIIYISRPSPDHLGNLALLEIPGKGRSSIPYYIQKKSKTGYISPIFSLEANDWTHKVIFESAPEDVKSVEVEFSKEKDESYAIFRDSKESEWQLKPLLTPGQTLTPDPFFANLYVENYKSIFYEKPIESFSGQKQDSIINSTPMYTIKLTEFGGEEVFFKAYPIISYKALTDEEEDEISKERFFGYYNNKLVLCQFFNMDKLFVKRSEFLIKGEE